jgi:hypothetical protein
MEEFTVAKRQLPNGRFAEVILLIYGRARLCLISALCASTYEDSW